MSEKYKIREKEKAYFTTSTIVGWIDVFTRPNHKMAIVNSLKHCIENKGLMIFAWCLMPGHRRAEGKADLSDILRDFKTFTSKKIISQVKEEPESRREWMLEFFARECSHLKRNQAYKVWQDDNQPKEIYSTSFLYEKLEYIHNNPVQDMIVENAWDYLFSSARNYAGMEGLLDVHVLDHKPLVKNWK